MKKDTHPDYHTIKIVMTNGVEYHTRSTCGAEGDSMRLDIDPSTHPACNKSAERQLKGGQTDRFTGRYGNLSFGKKATDAK